MKKTLQQIGRIWLIGLIGLITAHAQNVTKTLTLDGNGTVTKPDGFWLQNSSAIADALTGYFSTTDTAASFSADGIALGEASDVAAQRALLSVAPVVIAGGTDGEISGQLALGGDGKIYTWDGSTWNFAEVNHAASASALSSNLTFSGAVSGSGASGNITLSLTANATRDNLTGGNGPLNLGNYTVTLPASAGSNLTINASNAGSGTLPAARLPNITLNMSGVLHNSPVTIAAGNGTATLANQTVNTVLAGPATGNATAPTFRALVNADIPSSLSLSGNLSVNGATTIGDASGDTLTINAGTVTAPNASSTNATDVANVGALDARYGHAGGWKYLSATVTKNATGTGRALWERSITAMSGNGTVVTATVPTEQYLVAGQLFIITSSNPSSFNGVYLLISVTGSGASTQITFSSNNTATYTGSAYASRLMPVAKNTLASGTAGGIGGYFTCVAWEENTNNACDSSGGNFRVMWNSSSPVAASTFLRNTTGADAVSGVSPVSSGGAMNLGTFIYNGSIYFGIYRSAYSGTSSTIPAKLSIWSCYNGSSTMGFSETTEY